MSIVVTFYGAVREVTGSMHMMTTGQDRILLDCGMFQGRRRESAEKNRVLPFDPRIVTNIVLSHAHIDHSGRIPLVVKNHFRGRVICTRVTADACAYLLPDSGHIQEADAGYLNYKTVRAALAQRHTPAGKSGRTKREKNEIKQLLKKNRHELNVATIERLMARYHLQGVEPLYTRSEAEDALSFFDGFPYRHPITIGRETTCTFYDAGHILGSAVSIIKARSDGRSRILAYTGDIGRFDKPILNDPTLDFEEADRDIDLLIMESTYGNRRHEPVEDMKPALEKVLTETHERGGALLIPSFAYGRTQELLYLLHELYEKPTFPRFPVYVDSPLATQITRVFGEHPEVYDRDAHHTFLERGSNPFLFDQLRYVNSVEESMMLMREKRPHIVISASGMCEAGRILHHLRYKIHDPRNTILIVGYMARHTLGRRLLERGLEYEQGGRKGPAPMVRFLNKEYPLKARVVNLGGFSAHADQGELLRFLRESNLSVKRIAVVHGEEDQSLAFVDALSTAGYDAFVPRVGETVQVL